MIDRRQFCGGLLLGSLGAMLPAGASSPRTVTDMAGRTVRLAAAPKRIVLLEARDIVVMDLLHPDPAALVVGWAGVDRIDSGLLQARFERDRKIPVIGRQTPDTIGLEALLNLAPDLVVASTYMAPLSDGSLFDRLEKIGIPVVFSDVSSNAASQVRAGPIENLHRHMRMWGEILDAGDRAAAFLAFADEHLGYVAQRVATAPAVTTYLEVQSTLDDCCWAAGKQVWGELLALAGGKPLPAVTAPWFQKLQLEYLLTTPHDVYIASGGGWSSGGRPAIGPGIDLAQGREGLRRLVARPGFANLASVRHQRVHGIWTGLITIMPLSILFVEIVAKWLHPELFPDLDPAQTVADINRRFFSAPIDGPLWVSIQE